MRSWIFHSAPALWSQRISPAMAQPTRFNDNETAEVYERLLMPRVFRPWGELLLDRIGLQHGDKVLDVATGPGTLARAAAERTGPQGEVHGVDLSGPMLAQARAKPPIPEGAPLAYVQGPADALPYPDATFDVVCCQQGLQFFPDQPKALAEMRRVLKPGGKVGVASWDGPTGVTLMAIVMAAMDTVRGRPSDLPPMKWLDAESLRAMLNAAGFRQIRTERASYTMCFDSMEQAIACAHGTSSGTELRTLDPERQHRFRELMIEGLRPYVQTDCVRVPSNAILGLAHT